MRVSESELEGEGETGLDTERDMELEGDLAGASIAGCKVGFISGCLTTLTSRFLPFQTGRLDPLRGVRLPSCDQPNSFVRFMDFKRE